MTLGYDSRHPYDTKWFTFDGYPIPMEIAGEVSGVLTDLAEDSGVTLRDILLSGDLALYDLADEFRTSISDLIGSSDVVVRDVCLAADTPISDQLCDAQAVLE